MSHTPGPWIVESGDSTSKFIYDSKGEDGYLGALATVEHGDPDELDANARLIAAAPTMLQALEHALRDAEKGGFCSQTFDDVRAAIAKARGQ